MNRKSIALMLIVVFLLQSCVAYQKTSTSINVAQNEGRVKVVNTNGLKFVFKNIEYKDGVYYGFVGDEVLVIDTSEVLGVYLKDRRKSNVQTGLLIGGIALGLVMIVSVLAAYAAADATYFMFSTLAGGI